MEKYYTRACNFFYHSTKKKTKIPRGHYFLSGNKRITFDSVEIISRKSKKKIKNTEIKFLKKSLRNKIYSDLKKITKKKKFLKIKFKDTPLIMGVVNVTPDSFSDGGRYNSAKKAFIHAKSLIKAGCDIIDIGAESTRPGSKTINNKIEWKRLSAPLKKIKKLNKIISIDTRKTFVMEKSLKFKINLINDVSGLSHDKLTLNFLKLTKIPFVIHHTQGSPINMQISPKYKNVMLEIYDFFEKKIDHLRSFGIKHNNIILDPGIGFGKNLKHNMIILKNISIFHSLGFPLLIGTSKKRFIKDLSKNNDSKERHGGTISSNIFLMNQGVQILRVHDVNEINQGLKVYKALLE